MSRGRIFQTLFFFFLLYACLVLRSTNLNACCRILFWHWAKQAGVLECPSNPNSDKYTNGLSSNDIALSIPSRLEKARTMLAFTCNWLVGRDAAGSSQTSSKKNSIQCTVRLMIKHPNYAYNFFSLPQQT